MAPENPDEASRWSDPRLDRLWRQHLTCDHCGQRPWTQLARYSENLLCDACAANEEEPPEDEAPEEDAE